MVLPLLRKRDNSDTTPTSDNRRKERIRNSSLLSAFMLVILSLPNKYKCKKMYRLSRGNYGNYKMAE
jgi:hypothetical protein